MCKILWIQKTDLLTPSPCNYVENAFATIGVQSKTFGTYNVTCFTSKCVMPHDIT